MMKNCPNCGESVISNAQFCTRCGFKFDNIKQANNLPLVKKKKGTGCLITMLVFAVLMIVFAICLLNMGGPGEAKKVMNAAGITEEQADAVIEILSNCGVDEIDEIMHDEMLDDMNADGEEGYRVTTEKANNIILYLSDGKVGIIRWSDNDLYKDGKCISKLTDYVLTISEEVDLEIMSQDYVKNVLKSPSTAKFPNITGWKFHKDKEEIIIQSYVDSQNGFGATIRSEFQIVCTPDKSKVTSFIFDGEEYIK